ncbi:Nramp family divalent metal transporter [Pseudonocardia sp. MH-G8]|uniref:Nramp family divalent metal transporter n=1 Tax=Pseudonocardia sp. MH-G8 TaxID=1854588 RepID=UPI000BA09D50|nr:Nramp family divalent metal transporter [Pseudonocardia sp. MH-G8]OZM76408.1 divalent metal cation transporter [Pseudonocardia sp. MH-G8]
MAGDDRRASSSERRSAALAIDGGRPSRPPVLRRLMLLGPAFVAAIAYVDPGNFATNFSAGSTYGYLLLWVIVAANLMAMLIQSLSAKLGLATGQNLCELSRQEFRRPVVWGLWAQAEVVAMATDIAEVIGGAIALNLLFGLPLLHGGIITGVVAFALLGLHTRGQRRFEVAVGGLFAVIVIGFLVDLARVDVDAPALASGLVPGFAGTESVLLATGILGATVMPHVIYLHSALTQSRSGGRSTPVRLRLRYQRVDVVVAMGLAGFVNISMLVIAAALFHVPDGDGAGTRESLESVHSGLVGIDGFAALAFALALLASGLASSGVGTLSGQVVLQGYLRRRVPLVLRRALTLAPALTVLALGVDPTQALVLSQVVLSFGIPFALVPLVMFTRRVDLMGDLVNRRTTTVVAALAATVIIALNGFLLVQVLTGGTG